MAVSASDVKVLGTWPSAFLYRVQIALNPIDYEYVEETLSSKSDLLLAHNPVHKKIPVLIHALISPYVNLLRSSSILTRPGLMAHPFSPLIPTIALAVARFWAAYVEDKWIRLMGELKSEQRYGGRGARGGSDGMGRLDECMVVYWFWRRHLWIVAKGSGTLVW